MKFLSRYKVYFASGVLLALVALVGAGAAIGSDSAAPNLPSPKAPTASVGTSLKGTFGALRSGVKDRPVPDAIKSDLTNNPLAKLYGANAELGVKLTAAGKSAYVVPGADSVCLYVPDSTDGSISGTCTSAADAAAGKLSMRLTSENGDLVTGYALAPDGVTAANFSPPSQAGPAKTLAVSDNLAVYGSPAAH